ncbi:unnamed protein product [Closterium sp. NIES-54]
MRSCAVRPCSHCRAATRTACPPLRVAPYCSQRVAPYCSQRVPLCCPARRALLQPARHALLQPARRALLPCASRPAAASASFSAASHVAPCCSQRAALCCPTRHALLPCTACTLLPCPPRALSGGLRRALPGRAVPPSPSRPAQPEPRRPTLITSPTKPPCCHYCCCCCTCYCCWWLGAARSAGSAAGAGGAGGATGSAGGAAGARRMTGSAGGAAGAGAARGGQRRSLPLPDDPTPQQLREWRCVTGSIAAAALGASECAATLGASESAAALSASYRAAPLLRATPPCRSAPPGAEPRRPVELRHPTEPRRPAEPHRPTDLHCPARTAPAATAASAATVANVATAPTAAMASPYVLTFDAEGRAVYFDMWVDDLQHFLQCDSKDRISLFDHTSGVSPAPAATADSMVRSQWTTRDVVARIAIPSLLPSAERAHYSQYKTAKSLNDAVVARYSSLATAALSRLMLLYLFPDLAAFPTVADLITHLRTSDARYHSALPTEDHFLSLCPTELTINLLEERLTATEKSIVAVGASRGDPRAPFFEGYSPVPLLPSVPCAAAVNLVGTEEDGAASAPSGRRRNSKGKGGKGGGGDGGAGGGGGEGGEGGGGGGGGGRGRSGGVGPCTYVLRTGWRGGETCGLPNTTQRCFGCMIDAWRAQFPDAVELPCSGDLLKQNVAIFELDFDAILDAMYAVTDSAEGVCYLCVPPDPGIEVAALGASTSSALGTSESAALGAGESALSGTAPTESLHTFTLDSGALRSFFCDSTTLTSLSRPVAVSLADPSGGPVLAHSSTVLPLYTLTTASPQVSASGQVAASSQVFAAASRSSAESAPCSCRPLSHETLLWHRRLGHPSLPRLQGMASHTLFFFDNLRAFCRAEGIRQTFTLLASPQQNGIAERRIGMVMDVARTSMIHAAAPHFLWPFAVQYTAHQINLQPRVSLPETTPTLRWTGKVGDASVFRVWGSRAFVRDTSVDKLPSRAAPCCALGTDVLEDRMEELDCFAAALPHLVFMLLAPEGDPDAPDIPTPRSYAKAIEGPYSSQWQTAMDTEMASWKSTGTYVDEVPLPGANIGVDFFHTFSPTPKMTTLRVLLHVAAQHDYELHSLDFSTAFLQGSLHEEIWVRRLPGFTGSFPPGTQWRLRRPVYGLDQAPREWHDTLRTTLAALGFAPSTANPSLFLRTDTTLPPFYVLVSSCEAEIYAGAMAAQELRKLTYLLTDLGEAPRSPPVLLHLPTFSANLVSNAAIQDVWVDTFIHGGQRVAICTFSWTGRHLATFTRRPGSSLYTTGSAQVAEVGQVAASSQVSASGHLVASCLCRVLSHQTLLWHHRLGHPSLPRLRGMHSRLLVSGLPRSLPSLPRSPAPPCLPYIEGRQRAAPHSSEFPPTTAPLQTLHMDDWGPAPVGGTDKEHYFLLVVEEYTRYTTVFSLWRKSDVSGVLIPWIRATCRQLRERFSQYLPVIRLHSDRGGEFSSGLFCRDEGIIQSFTLPAPPRQNGFAEHCICLIMERPRPHSGGPGSLAMRRCFGSEARSPLFAMPKRASSPFAHFAASSLASPPTPRRGIFTTRAHVESSPPMTSPFDEFVCYYRLPPHTSHPVPLAPLFLVLVPPPLVDPLSPPGPAPSGVSQVDSPPLVEPLEVSSDSSGQAEGGDPAADDSAATRHSPHLETPPAETAGAEPWGAEIEGEGSGGAATGGAGSGGPASPSGGGTVGDPAGGPGAGQPPQPDLLETLSPQAIRAWIVRQGSPSGGGYGPDGAGAASPGGTAGAGGTGGTAGAGGAAGVGGTRGAAGVGGTRGAAGAGGAGATSPRGATGAGGAGPTILGSKAGAGGAASASGAGPRGTGGAGAAGLGGARTGGAGGARAGGAVRAGGATRAAGSGGTGGTAGAGGAGAAGAGGTAGARGAGGATGAVGIGGAGGTAGTGGAGAGGTGDTGGNGAAGPGGARTRGTRAAGAGGADGAGGAGGASGPTSTGGAGGTTGARGPGAVGASGVAGAGGAGGAGGAAGAAGAGGAGAAGAGGAEAAEQSQPQLLSGSLLPALAPHTEVIESLTERREPETRASTPVRAHRVARPRPLAVPGTHGMALRPSSVPLRVVLPEPPVSSLLHVPDPESDVARAARPTVTRLLTTIVTDPNLESTAAFALVTELVDFAARSHLDYVASLVTESESVCPPSVRGELALGSDVLEDRQFELECLADALPRFASMLLCPKGHPHALDIPTQRSYAEAITGEYSS